jgi:hypothetical protein
MDNREALRPEIGYFQYLPESTRANEPAEALIFKGCLKSEFFNRISQERRFGPTGSPRQIRGTREAGSRPRAAIREIKGSQVKDVPEKEWRHDLICAKCARAPPGNPRAAL